MVLWPASQIDGPPQFSAVPCLGRYEPPPGSLLVGDGVIELGEIVLVYGPPGSFKGFAVGDLMACGAWGRGEWLGHPVNAQFASLWLNCENGRRRLRDQFSRMKLPEDAENYIHVTDIPAVWNLADARLAGEIRRIIVEKKIRLLIVDTVSNFTEDEFAKQFAAFFSALNTLLHGLDPRPAVLLIWGTWTCSYRPEDDVHYFGLNFHVPQTQGYYGTRLKWRRSGLAFVSPWEPLNRIYIDRKPGQASALEFGLARQR